MKFALFRFAGGVLQVLAWVVLVVSIVMAIVVLTAPMDYWMRNVQYPPGMGPENIRAMRWVAFVVFIIGGIAGWAALLVFSGILSVLISIESSLSPRTVPPQPQAVSGPTCPNCGARIKPGDLFCQNCGAKL
ncbi:MAG: zinc ribbon domain-containing protein [Caldiserica bacterium]|nr:zinc ribbon domain-containing protein [Caldisericota bacterium]MDH7562541.1 zinc ribbon domain-containing protein [Caldisericota bacterium]